MSDKKSLSADKIHASRRVADDKREPITDNPPKLVKAVGCPRKFNPTLMANVRERIITGNTRSASGTKNPVMQPAIGGGINDVHLVVNITTNTAPGPSVEKPAIDGGKNVVHRVVAGDKGNYAGPSKPERRTENPGKIPTNNSSDDEEDEPFDTDDGQAVEPPQVEERGDPKQKIQPRAGHETTENSAGPSKPEKKTENPGKIPNENSSDD